MHTTQRNAILDEARTAMRDGEAVRIVRSYQLMTEEDFNKLVQAMREQVQQAAKEEQFNMLWENFGDRESQIDDEGFMWRQRMMAMPSSDDPDQYLAGNVDEFYTDNDLYPAEGDEAYRNSQLDDVQYNDGPLYPEEDIYNVGEQFAPYYEDGEDYRGDGDGNDEYTPQEGPGEVGNAGEYSAGGDYGDYNYDKDEGAYPPEGDDGRIRRGGERYGHDRKRHRHRHRRSRDEVGAREPEPRSPLATADAFTPSEQFGSSQRRWEREGGSLSKRASKRTSGRQAEVEEDYAEGDELSGGGFDAFY